MSGLECLNSLNDPAARFRVQEVEPVRQYNPKTFEWLFTNQVSFSRWLVDDRGEFDAIFWITGRPGSGKSTLMRFALEDSRTMSLQPSDSRGDPMAYFFHLRGKSLVQKSLRGMLMELLHQVLEQYPRSFELIRPIFVNLKRLKQDWDVRSLSQALLHIPHIPPAVPGRRDRITLFVDALDENQNQDDNNNLLSIFQDLSAAYRSVRVKGDAPVLKICLASRPWPIFRQRLGDDPRVASFAIHDFTAKDIEIYTKSQLLTTKNMLKSSGERQKAISQLSSYIASRARGVFIWVRVVVDNLRQDIVDGTAIESLRGIIHEYPEELDDMYKFTLKRVREPYRPETMILFKAMLASRIPLTALQLYTITNICMGLPQLNHGSTEGYAEILSWLASRSGGLIELVATGGEELYPAAPDAGAEKPHRELQSDFSTGPDPHAEFLHQTVQDFVRKSLNDTLEIAELTSSVAQLSGSRLLALACLDRHPPHPQLRKLAEDIFSYLRVVEGEEDEAKGPQMTWLPHWESFDLHDFPFKVLQPQIQLPMATTPEMFGHYMDTSNALVQKIVSSSPESDSPWNFDFSSLLAPYVVIILNNLYRTRGPEHSSRFALDLSPDAKHILLFIASVGPRLSNDRVDRQRMFQHIHTSYLAAPLRGLDLSKGSFFNKYLGLWSDSLIIEPIGQVSILERPGSLASRLACSKPSTELDDDTLLSFAQRLGGDVHNDTIIVELPGINTPESQDKLPHSGRRVFMTLSAFCSRFRDINRSEWVAWAQLLETGINSPPPLRGHFLLDHLHEPTSAVFVDLAIWDAVGAEPPYHTYTQNADEGNIVAQAIASACMPAALVGGGGSRVFKALYMGYTPARRNMADP